MRSSFCGAEGRFRATTPKHMGVLRAGGMATANVPLATGSATRASVRTNRVAGEQPLAAAGCAHGGGAWRRGTGTLGSYAAALEQIPELRGVEHVQGRSVVRRKNRVERLLHPTRIRGRVMPHFTPDGSAQHFLSERAH